jgi:hypothetical protein
MMPTETTFGRSFCLLDVGHADPGAWASGGGPAVLSIYQHPRAAGAQRRSKPNRQDDASRSGLRFDGGMPALTCPISSHDSLAKSAAREARMSVRISAEKKEARRAVSYG